MVDVPGQLTLDEEELMLQAALAGRGPGLPLRHRDDGHRSKPASCFQYWKIGRRNFRAFASTIRAAATFRPGCARSSN